MILQEHGEVHVDSCGFRVVPIDNLLGTLHAEMKAGSSHFAPADVSLNSVAYVLGVPYLVPLWIIAIIERGLLYTSSTST